MRLPTFSRQSETTTETDSRAPVRARTDSAPAAVQADRAASSSRPAADRAATAESRAVVAEDRAVIADNRATAAHSRAVTENRAAHRADERTEDLTPPQPHGDATTARLDRVDDTTPRDTTPRDTTPRDTTARPAPAPAAMGRKPRASLLATLGLITAVGGALLVLSGPLLGYGIGVAGLALVLSLAGLRATRKRHVAGKTDALIGLIVAIGAIVTGVLALTGSLSWLGTDLQPVSSLREWLDAQFVDRF